MLRRIIRTHAVRPYGDGTGVLCQSFGLLIGMCYVLSRGLRLLPVIFHPFGVLLAFPSPVGVKNASGILIAKRRTQKETASGSFDSRRRRTHKSSATGRSLLWAFSVKQLNSSTIKHFNNFTSSLINQILLPHCLVL